MLRTEDFGVVVVCGGVTSVGIVKMQDDPQLMGRVVGQNGRVRSVLIRTADLGTLALSGAITVDGTAYVARDIQAEAPDGLFTRIELHG